MDLAAAAPGHTRPRCVPRHRLTPPPREKLSESRSNQVYGPPRKARTNGGCCHFVEINTLLYTHTHRANMKQHKQSSESCFWPCDDKEKKGKSQITQQIQSERFKGEIGTNTSKEADKVLFRFSVHSGSR